MKKKWVIFTVALLAVLAVSSVGFAEGGKKMARSGQKIVLAPDDIQWKEGPQALPGVKLAVLEGDPKKKGFFVMRLKLPAGTKIPAHVHNNMERVTIISGKFNLAEGDKSENPKVLPAGGYFSFSPNSVHNAWVDEETVVQIGTTGPWTFKPIK
ncbi:MAG: cupin domain-containing protein [Nitrospirae bacterium]|nr:cupin domain-containing protein [Nitrospirota bacterium]